MGFKLILKSPEKSGYCLGYIISLDISAVKCFTCSILNSRMQGSHGI